MAGCHHNSLSVTADRNSWHTGRRGQCHPLIRRQFPGSPSWRATARAVCPAAPGLPVRAGQCHALRRASPVSTVEQQQPVYFRLVPVSPAGIPRSSLLGAQRHRPAGGNSPDPPSQPEGSEDQQPYSSPVSPWPHTRVSWNRGREAVWTGHHGVNTRCHHDPWESVDRSSPKPHHLHVLPFSHFSRLKPSPLCFWGLSIYLPFAQSFTLHDLLLEPSELFSASSIRTHLSRLLQAVPFFSLLYLYLTLRLDALLSLRFLSSAH